MFRKFEIGGKMRRMIFLIFVLFLVAVISRGVRIEKDLLYDTHTLQDDYAYGKLERCFQWEKIAGKIDSILIFEEAAKEFGALNNYKNRNGVPPLADSVSRDVYRAIQDKYGVKRDQSVPFYRPENLSRPKRYGRDGTLVSILKDTADYLWVVAAAFEGEWLVPSKYVDRLGGADFRRLIFVDRTNQNIATLEYESDTSWLVRSMNPATTGVQRPPFRRETPIGIYVVRTKLKSMAYLKDSGQGLGGYAPWASRFTGGAYVHGVPVAYPGTVQYEFSRSLGTTPRSHMCVRNATSHAKFIYDWAAVDEALVIVFD